MTVRDKNRLRKTYPIYRSPQVLRAESTGVIITDYATREELESASLGSLSEGYYSVASNSPDILTYWDGSSFDPPLSLWDSDPAFLEDSTANFGGGWTADDETASTELP